MKMSQFLDKSRQVSEAYTELTAADIKKINQTQIRNGGVLTYHAHNTLGVKTDGDKTLQQQNRTRGKVNEASALHDVTIDDDKGKPSEIPATPSKSGLRTADQLDVNAEVQITGNVQFKGKTGEISRFGKDKKFVIVSLYDGGDHSFHSSDVTELELSLDHDEDEDEDKDDDDEQDTFYIAFYDEDEERSWIGTISKEGGGKWHEHPHKGKPDYRWGQSYMSYLKPSDIMTWIHKDYSRNVEIEGPFFDEHEAEQHVKINWGTLEENRVDFTNYSEWKAAAAKAGLDILNSSPVVALTEDRESVRGKWMGTHGWLQAEAPLVETKKEESKPEVANASLLSAIAEVGKDLRMANYVGSYEKPKIKRMINQLTVVVASRRHFFKVYNTWMAEEPDMMDLFVDMLLERLNMKSIDEIEAKFFNVKEDLMRKLNDVASRYGTEFHLLEATVAAEFVDFKKANELAPAYGKNRFWTLSKDAMAELVNDNPGVVIGLSESVDNPSKAELESYRQLALRTIEKSHNMLHHIAEEELVACKVYRVEAIGSVTDKKKFTAGSDIDVGFYADCNDKPRKKGMQEDLSEKLQMRLIKHPLPHLGVINCLVFHEDIKSDKLKEDMHDSWTNVEKWKTAVKNAYPEVAKKLVFKAKIEAGVSTISAEVPGEDRSYGVWDMDEKVGHVLGESKEN